MSASWVLAGYGFFTVVGGLIGYAKANSSASLIAGTISGGLMLLCAEGMRRGSQPAAVAGLVISALLAARFAGTWRTKRRLMPDLLMVLGGLATVGVLVRSLLAR